MPGIKIMKYPHDRKGLTLVELLVTMTVVGIILLAMGASMRGWATRYRVESVTHDLYTDLTEARANALQQGRSYFATFQTGPPDSYSLYSDVNGNRVRDDAVLPTFPKELGEYRLMYALDSGLPEITLNRRGMVEQSGYVRVVPDAFYDDIYDNNNSVAVEADYDCLVLQGTRIKMGRWNGACNPR